MSRAMRYLSVCSGIEAATVAWDLLGWEAAAFSEIEPFPCAVLAHHYPDTPNLGDMTAFKEWQLGTVDLLVGGTPCQSFSVAGLRRGLDDPRGNLMLIYLAIARGFAPRWVVWENVPGVLSSNGGRDFGTLLGGLAECGYGFAYRVLDAQFFGVPQRRRRVFVVGHLGDWRAAAAVLFERESLRGYPPPSREAGERVAAVLTRGAESSGKGGYAGRRREDDENLVAFAVNAHGGSGRMDGESETFVAEPITASYAKHGGAAAGKDSKPHNIIAQPLRAGRQYSDMGDGSANIVTHALRADGFDASEDGTGRGTPLVGVTIHGTGKTARVASYTDTAGALRARTPGGQENSSTMAIQAGMAVRRLTPRECERLQGFPDDYTAIPYRGKPAADGPRYKALGNSMAVPVMRWIGQRIEATHE